MPNKIMIRCPNCPRGVLFSIYENGNYDEIEGRCDWCKTFAIYNNKTKSFTNVKRSDKIKNK